MAFGGNVFETEISSGQLGTVEASVAAVEAEVDVVEGHVTSLEGRAPVEKGRTGELEKSEEHEILAAGVTATGAILVDTEGVASTVRVTARTAGKGFKVETTAKAIVNWAVFA